MITPKLLNMSYLLIGVLTLLVSTANAQNDDGKALIQNFYTSCKSKNYMASASVSKGVQLFETKQYARAKKSFEKALSIDENYCDAWHLIGYCYQKTGELDKAIEACDKSLALEANNASALIIKANTLFLKGNVAAATELFKKVKELLPKKVDGYYGLALMLHHSNKTTEAKAVLTEMKTNKVKTAIIRDNKKIKNLRKELGVE